MEKYNMEMELSPDTIPGKMMGRIQSNSTVLEFGCAYGRMTKHMCQQLHCKVYIAELDPEAYACAKEFAEDGYCGDVENDTWFALFENKKFDYILFADVLEHLRNPVHVLTQARKLLKESGEIIISIPNIGHNDILVKLYQNRFEYTSIGLLDETHVHFWGVKDLKKIAEETGCILRLVDGVYQLPFGTEQHPQPEETSRAIKDALACRPYNEVYQLLFVLQDKVWAEKKGISTEVKLRQFGDDFLVFCYWDTGEGYTPGQVTRLEPQNIAGEKFRFFCDSIPSACRRARFDPPLGYFCVITDIHVVTNIRSCEIRPLNGTTVRGITVFANTNPQMEFDLPAGAQWFEITTNIQVYSGDYCSELFTAIQDLPALQRQNHDLQEQLLDAQTSHRELNEARLVLNEKAATLEMQVEKNLKIIADKERKIESQQEELLRVQSMYQQLAAQAQNDRAQYALQSVQYEYVIHSKSWRITRPLRAAVNAVKNNTIGMLLYKTVKSLRTSGLKSTLYKIKKFRSTKLHRLNPGVSESTPQTLTAMADGIVQMGGTVYGAEKLMSLGVNSKKKCLLVSHEMNLTGAPIALSYLAKTVENMGHFPVFIAPWDGKLSEQLLEKAVPTFIYEGLFQTDYVAKCAGLFDYIVVCTNVGAPLVAQLNGGQIPVLWWIHEARVSYHPGALAAMPVTLAENIHVYCGGGYAERLLHEYRPNYKIKQLLYYVPDYSRNLPKNLSFILEGTEGKTVFAVIGMQEQRKGQDILVSAIRMLSPEDRKQCLFVFAGKPCYEPIRHEIESICSEFPENVRYIQELGRADLMALYMQIDCLICTSRDDPMPIVVTEAMLMSKVIICSENTGSADLLEQENAGLIYRNDDPSELKRDIEHVLEFKGTPDLMAVAQRARETYESFFSYEMCCEATKTAINRFCGDKENLQTYDGKVSVIIPTYNAGDSVENLLVSLQNQKMVKGVEIIVVDSESKDGTAERAEHLGAKVIRIKQSEFSHSFARNLGAEHASGEYLLFMTQDAMPNGDLWICGLMQPVLKDGVVAVSCQEEPRPNCDLLGRISIWLHSEYMGILEANRIMKLPADQSYDNMRRNGQLNDVTCLVQRNAFMELKYRGDYAEDLDLGIRLIQAGYTLALLSNVQVIHSHTRPAFYHMKRALVDLKTLKKILPNMPIENVSAQCVANRIITAHYVVLLLADHMGRQENICSWEFFCTWLEQEFLKIKAILPTISREKLLTEIQTLFPGQDQNLLTFVKELYANYAEQFQYDLSFMDTCLYFIVRTLTRYWNACGAKFTQEMLDETMELLPKYTAQLYGIAMASYVISYPDEKSPLNDMAKKYSAGV